MPARIGWIVATACALALAATSVAGAHVERTSYWPDPAPDTSVTPPAGGAVPSYRPLSTNRARLRTQLRGAHVVCQPDSMARLERAVQEARTTGVVLRPSAGAQRISEASARRYLAINRQLEARCRYDSVQAAVNAVANNGRVVIMPGLYTEPASRAAPTSDPRCAGLRETSENGSGALSYRYHVDCPNDQSLVYLGGRAPGPGDDPPPREDRHGIPNEGPCIRCNVTIEGSGPSPDDVVLDAGRVESGNGGPAEPVKDVVLRADRADGLVVRGITFRHAREHGLYVHETDGYLIERAKFFHNEEYGTLTFTDDHGLTRDCEAAGHGDSGLYPGAAADTGPRLNQTITRCDSHHNVLGYSGTMGNAVHVIDNEFYDNATGIATDSFFAGGHPGFPQDSSVFESNRISSNNFNVYLPDSDVKPTIPVPVGTGILIAGGNQNVVKDNTIYDNWRRGTMLVAVPDLLAGEDGLTSTSFSNRYVGNHMGVAPDGQRRPNGVDFWWDEFVGNTGNCWERNGAVTSDPARLPTCHGPSVGLGNVAKEVMLAVCALELDGCEWFTTPTRPGRRARAAARKGGARFPWAWERDCGLSGSMRGLAGVCDLFASSAGGLTASSPNASKARCGHWRAADERGRRATLAEIRNAAGGTIAGVTVPVGPVLPDADAYALFERACGRSFAGNVLLYKLYVRAAGFWEAR